MRKDLSVIIPSFNRRESLSRLLESLASQTLGADRFEVVVVLDGSTDGSSEAVKAREWPFELSVLEQANQGAGAARNAGVRVASGRVFLFLDDDVVPVAGALQAHLDGHARDPGSAIIGAISTQATSRGYPAWAGPNYRRARRMAEDNAGVVFHRYLASGNFSLPADLFPADGFREDMARLEDVEVGHRLSLAGIPLRLIPEALVVHHGQKSTAELLADASAEARTIAALWETEADLVRFLSPIRKRKRSAVEVRLAMTVACVPLPDTFARVLGATPGWLGGPFLFRALRRYAYLRGIGGALSGRGQWTAYLNRDGESVL